MKTAEQRSLLLSLKAYVLWIQTDDQNAQILLIDWFDRSVIVCSHILFRQSISLVSYLKLLNKSAPSKKNELASFNSTIDWAMKMGHLTFPLSLLWMAKRA